MNWNENALVKLASPPAERRSEKRIEARSVIELIARLLKLKLPSDTTWKGCAKNSALLSCVLTVAPSIPALHSAPVLVKVPSDADPLTYCPPIDPAPTKGKLAVPSIAIVTLKSCAAEVLFRITIFPLVNPAKVVEFHP